MWRLLSSKQRLKRWKGATGITRIQIFQPYSLRRHYHICLKATLWNTLQRDPKPRDMNTKSRRRLYVNRNPNGGCNYNHHHVIRHAELDLEHMYKKSTVNRISYILIFVVYLKLVVVVVYMILMLVNSSSQ